MWWLGLEACYSLCLRGGLAQLGLARAAWPTSGASGAASHTGQPVGPNVAPALERGGRAAGYTYIPLFLTSITSICRTGRACQTTAPSLVTAGRQFSPVPQRRWHAWLFFPFPHNERLRRPDGLVAAQVVLGGGGGTRAEVSARKRRDRLWCFWQCVLHAHARVHARCDAAGRTDACSVERRPCKCMQPCRYACPHARVCGGCGHGAEVPSRPMPSPLQRAHSRYNCVGVLCAWLGTS